MKKVLSIVSDFAAVLAVMAIILSGLHVRVVTDILEENWYSSTMAKANTIEYHNFEISRCVNDETQTVYVPTDKMVRIWFAW